MNSICARFQKNVKRGFTLLLLLMSASTYAELDPSTAIIAAPVDFNAVLIDESTVELSWNPELLDGSDVSYFKVRNANTLLGQTTENTWRVSNINRNISYDFSVSAVTVNGEQTRRSHRISIDLPQLDESTPDGYNAYLPPIENLQAKIIDSNTIELSWSAAKEFWSYVDSANYSYYIFIGNSGATVVQDTSYTLTNFDRQGLFWITVYAGVEGQNLRGENTSVLVDTASAPGTVSNGYPGFSSVLGLRTAVYSRTAAELFWEKSGSPTTTHIYIDGRLIERMHEGTSLFLDNFEPGKRTLVSVGEGFPYDPKPSNQYFLDYDWPLMHVWVETAPGEQPKTGDPGPVTGLRYDIYGPTSAEIFWDRSAVVPTLYRIYLNGEFLTETDGVSWHSRDLPNGSDITIGVTAIGPNGIESNIAEVRFNTAGDNDDNGNSNGKCAVTGLRAAVYGHTSAEVFWDRNNAGTQFNVTLDGEFQVKTDATSWYSNSYASGSSHSVAVSKADANCNTSAAVVEFDLKGSSKPVNQSELPTKPGDLRAIAYSSSHAELFWTPSTDDGWVMGYDILRDGEKVAEMLDAKSYNDFNLSTGKQYTYSVIAVDNDGNRSEQAAISLSTLGRISDSLINRTNHVEIIRDIFDIYVGDTYTDPLDKMSEFFITGRNPDFSFIDVFNCESGSYEQELNPTSTNSGVFFTFDFDECVFDGAQHNGYVTGQDYSRGLTFSTNLLSIVEVASDNYAQYTGDIRKWITQTAFFDTVHSFETDGASIEVKNEDSNLLLEQMQTSFAYGRFNSGLDVAWLRGGFHTRLNDIDGPLITASTPIELSYKLNTSTDGRIIDDVPPSVLPVTKELRNNWTFTTGQLLLTAEDGSTLLLDADNGNQQTVNITITSDRGTDVLNQPWSLWSDVLRFDRFPNIIR